MIASQPCELLLAAQAPMAELAQSLQGDWLSATEKRRLASVFQPKRRAEFLACRYALRQLMAGQDTAQQSWMLDALPGQSPSVNAQAHGDIAHRYRLSLSHSGDLLACTVATQPIGIDLEVQNFARARDVMALAELVCSDAERGWLEQCSNASDRQHGFMQRWCLKEAYFKALGSGIDMALIRDIECQPQATAGSPLLAFAQSWQGIAKTGELITLAVCTLEPLASVVLRQEVEIDWVQHCHWGLVSAPFSGNGC